MKKETDKERLNLTAEPEMIRMIDDWRRGQPDLPNRSEAMRRLIRKGLGLDA